MSEDDYNKTERHSIREGEQRAFGFRYGGEIVIIKNEGPAGYAVLTVQIVAGSYELRYEGDNVVVPAGNLKITSRAIASDYLRAMQTTLECRHYKPDSEWP
jgi:hypothetical protein